MKIDPVTVIGVILIGTLIGVGAAALGGAFFMVALMLVHDDLPVVPALGFWASFGSLLALASIGAALRQTVNVKT